MNAARRVNHQPLDVVYWGCQGCSAIGHFTRPWEEDCLTTDARINEAHAIASPDCKAHPFTKTRRELLKIYD